MLENITGHLIIVMAPTGSGKGTLIKDALEHFPDLETTISLHHSTTASWRDSW